jgi:hypothetical protein
VSEVEDEVGEFIEVPEKQVSSIIEATETSLDRAESKNPPVISTVLGVDDQPTIQSEEKSPKPINRDL